MTRRVIEKGGRRFMVEESAGTAWGFWQFWADGHWEPPTIAAAERLLKPGDVLLDIGAWVGPLTLWAAASCGARVVAVEPDPAAFAQLKHNVEASGLSDRVLLIDKAVAMTPEVELFTTEEQGDAYSSTTPRGELSRRLTVEAVRLRTLVGIFSPAVVKIDIEGGEAAIMAADGAALRDRGCALLLATHEPWYPPEAVKPFYAELEHWRLIEDLKNDMWLYEPRTP